MEEIKTLIQTSVVFYDCRPQEQFAHPLSMNAVTVSFPSHIANADPNIGNNTAEARQVFSNWGTLTTRLLSGSHEIEVVYSVGPIPVDDGIGKEVIIRYSTNIQSSSRWYTDSNGKEMQLRVRDRRPTFNYSVGEPVASNYYPINALVVLSDSQHSLAVLPDRSHGGSSLRDGSVELMLHRRLLHDDNYGVGENLDETETISTGEVRGLTIGGKQKLLLTASMSTYSLARPAQSRVYATPHLSIATLTGPPKNYITHYATTMSLLQSALPVNVELATMQPFANGGSVLMRLVHLFGVGEDGVLSQPVSIDLTKVFVWKIVSITQVSLTATTPADSHKRLNWKIKSEDQQKNVNPDRVIGGLNGAQVLIAPAEVLTFVVNFDRS